MDLSIIIPSFNTKEILRNCLQSILDNTKKITFEIIVVDNNSCDKSPEMIEKNFSSVKLIQNEENLGFAKANNQGINKATGKYILFLNSDTLITNKAIEKMVDFMINHKEIDAIGPKLLNLDNSIQPSAGFFPNPFVVFNMLFLEHFLGGRFVRTSYPCLKKVDWVMGAALMVKKEITDKIGGFDEKIFMYYDEVDYCYRIYKAGDSIYYYPEAEIIHLWQKSSQSGREGPILANYKSLQYFYNKHYGLGSLVLLKVLLKTKAIAGIVIGNVFNNHYLKETYEKALKLV